MNVIRDGYNRLWGWFGLSRDSFLVLPRVLMHDMPDDWQARLAVLLDEWDAAHPHKAGFEFKVMAMREGRLVPMPGWLLRYRQPDRAEIDKLKGDAA
jgi:hypothetical protein